MNDLRESLKEEPSTRGAEKGSRGRAALKAAGASLLLTLLVGMWAACAKVRIDARAHLAAAQSLRDHALSRGSAEDLAGAGIRFARAIRSCSPLDPTPGRAAGELESVADELQRRGRRLEAMRVLGAGVGAIDSCGVLIHPYAAERDEIWRRLERLSAVSR